MKIFSVIVEANLYAYPGEIHRKKAGKKLLGRSIPIVTSR